MNNTSPAASRPSLFSRIAAGDPITPTDISQSAEARVLPRSRLAAYTYASYWNDERDGDWSPGDESPKALILAAVAALADGRLSLTEARVEIMEAAIRGSLGTGRPRRASLRWADDVLNSIAGALPVLRSPEGRSARKTIADHFRPLMAPPEQAGRASAAQLVARRERVRAIAGWAMLVAEGDDPLDAAQTATSHVAAAA